MNRALIPERVEVEPSVVLSVLHRPAKVESQTLVFSNSLAADHRMWDSVIAELPDDLGIVTYDTRGHGGSSVSATGFGVGRLGEDVLAVMARLEIMRPVFCGLSLGGMIGQWLGQNHADQFAGIILANTAMKFVPAEMWTDRARHARSGGMAQFVTPTLERWLTEAFRNRNPEVSNLIADMIAATPAVGFAACCEVLAATDLRGAMLNCHLPVLRISGTHDPSTPPAFLEAIEFASDQPDNVILDAAHLSSVEQPASFSAAIEDFLQQLA